MPAVERVMHPLRVRRLEVTAVERIAPRMARITFAGDLDGFAAPSPDDHVKVIFPVPGEKDLVLPRIGERGLEPAPGQDPPVMRDYTPRAFDVAAGTLVLDFVLHDHGPAGAWASAAAPGDVVGQAGPRGSRVASEDFDWWLLVGDETALPAIGRRLEELPSGARAFVVCEVEGPEDEVELPAGPGVEVRWLHRSAGAEGLEAAVAALGLPDGDGFAWAAAEAEVARGLRRHFREDRGMPAAFAKATGYWKRGAANHHDPPDAD